MTADPSPLRLLRRLAGRRAFFFGFLIRWVLHLAFSLIRGVAMHESSSCSREDALGDCGRPCDHFSCLLFTALWLVAANLYWCRRLRLRRMLHSHVLSLPCSELSHVCQQDSCPWFGLFLNLTDSKIPVLRFLLMLLATDYDVWIVLLLSILDGDRALFRHNCRFHNPLQGGMVVAPF